MSRGLKVALAGAAATATWLMVRHSGVVHLLEVGDNRLQKLTLLPFAWLCFVISNVSEASTLHAVNTTTKLCTSTQTLMSFIDSNFAAIA